MLGGLLSAHLLAEDPQLGLYPGSDNNGADTDKSQPRRVQGTTYTKDAGSRGKGVAGRGAGIQDSRARGDVPEVYRGELLALAEDLGRRLLPAFETPTGEWSTVVLANDMTEF